MRTVLVLAVFAAVFMILTVSSYRQESATIDEPHYLTAGYVNLKLGDHRFDLDHLPFLQMWTALPLMAMPDVHLNTNDAVWSSAQLMPFIQRFLYRDNDADRLLDRARFMTVLLGLLLGALLFAWANELWGGWPATFILGLYCFEPNILAHSHLATTDLGIACFIFGTVYFLWRTTQKFSGLNLAGVLTFFALAQLSKYSALVLIPILVVLLALYTFRSHRWRAALGLAAALVVFCYVAIWAAYGFRYAPGPVGSGLDRIVSGAKVHEDIPVTSAVADWLDERKFLPNAYTQGFVLRQALGRHLASYWRGHIQFSGRWYYFPAAFLIKTPVALLVLFGAGLMVCAVNRSKFGREDAYILLPLAIYFGTAMTMDVNVGLRHVLPIYPFVLLIAGRPLATAVNSRKRVLIIIATVLLAVHACESTTVHPHYLAFFNQLVGGPKNGHKYLADSNIDWGQDLKNLKKWMDTSGVAKINLAYFGSADPAYYGVKCVYLVGCQRFAPTGTEPPELPGLVAVSVQNLTGASRKGDRFYWPLLNAQPIAVIGYSIRIYRVDRPWW